MKKYLLTSLLVIVLVIVFFNASSKSSSFSDLLDEEFHLQEIDQIIVERRDENTGQLSFLVVDRSGKIKRMINGFSTVLLKEYKLNKNKHIDNEYVISFQQLSETHNLYANQDVVRFKGSAFKLQENDFIEVINSLYISEDWLDSDEYADYYAK